MSRMTIERCDKCHSNKTELESFVENDRHLLHVKCEKCGNVAKEGSDDWRFAIVAWNEQVTP